MSENNPVYDRKDTLKYATVRVNAKPNIPLKETNMIEEALDPNIHNVFATCQGTVMMICDRFILPNVPDEGIVEAKRHGVCAYQGVDFITLSKKDAQNIADMLFQLCESHPSATDKQVEPVVQVFPDKGVSFERLLDRLDGEFYPPTSIYDRKVAGNTEGQE